MTTDEAWFSVALRPQKPSGSLGRKAQDGHLDFHTTPELALSFTGGFGLALKSVTLCRHQKVVH